MRPSIIYIIHNNLVTLIKDNTASNNGSNLSKPGATQFSIGERGGSVVECRTLEREVRGSRPTAAVLCPWARHFTPRKYWLITQEAMAPSRHDWKIVDWDVKPQHNQPTIFHWFIWTCILKSTAVAIHTQMYHLLKFSAWTLLLRTKMVRRKIILKQHQKIHRLKYIYINMHTYTYTHTHMYKILGKIIKYEYTLWADMLELPCFAETTYLTPVTRYKQLSPQKNSLAETKHNLWKPGFMDM